MVLEEGTLAHTKTVSGPVSVPHLIYSSKQITSSLWTPVYLATNQELVSLDFLGVGREQKPGIRCLARARQVPGDLRILHHLIFKLFFSFYRSENTYPRSHSKEHRLRAGELPDPSGFIFSKVFCFLLLPDPSRTQATLREAVSALPRFLLICPYYSPTVAP